jgi:hypothetical protein
MIDLNLSPIQRILYYSALLAVFIQSLLIYNLKKSQGFDRFYLCIAFFIFSSITLFVYYKMVS